MITDKREEELIKIMRDTNIFKALRNLKSAENKRKSDLKRKYGENSLNYIRYLHNYYTISPARKSLEEEYMRESWNLMQKVGNERADEILDTLEKYMS